MKKLVLSKEKLRDLTAQEVEQVAGGGYVPTRSPLECYSLQANCIETARCHTNNCPVTVGP